jgi:hypothetical protein
VQACDAPALQTPSPVHEPQAASAVQVCVPQLPHACVAFVSQNLGPEQAASRTAKPMPASKDQERIAVRRLPPQSFGPRSRVVHSRRRPVLGAKVIGSKALMQRDFNRRIPRAACLPDGKSRLLET